MRSTGDAGFEPSLFSKRGGQGSEKTALGAPRREWSVICVRFPVLVGLGSSSEARNSEEWQEALCGLWSLHCHFRPEIVEQTVQLDHAFTPPLCEPLRSLRLCVLISAFTSQADAMIVDGCCRPLGSEETAERITLPIRTRMVPGQTSSRRSCCSVVGSIGLRAEPALVVAQRHWAGKSCAATGLDAFSALI